MIKKLSITILVDNHSSSSDLLTEHGLSIWIEAGDYRILFDTGQCNILVHNADILGIDLCTVDTLVLSHGHYDHTGGVAGILKLNPKAAIYCHPGVFTPRFSRQPDSVMKPVGINKQASNALHQVVNTIHWTSGPTSISADIGITGSIPRESAYENTGGAFYLDPKAKKPDPIDDDLAMWFRTVMGIVIVTGCCHSGLINTIAYTKTLTNKIPIHTVIGGFHLLNASSERIGKTCDYLLSNGIKQIVPCHCTGENAVGYMKVQCGQRVVLGGVGTYLQIR